MSPQSESVLMWLLTLAVNALAILGGIVWGWSGLVQFLPSAVGAVAGAALVSHGLHR